MDRRRKSIGVEGAGKKRGLMLPPIGKKDFQPAVMNMRRPSNLGVTDSNPAVIESGTALTIDPNLLVGHVYDNTKQRQAAIKDQLGDITQRLHRTLNEFDVMYDNEEKPDDLLHNITNRINDIENDDTKHHFKNFINQYRDMSDEFQEANKEREELMYSLADWFTMDHLDLDDKLSMNESDESNMKNDYASAQMNFEKIKRLQAEILKANIQGKNAKPLIEEKKRIEKNVMGNIRILRERNNSVSDKSSKVADESPWKYCTDEIVGLLRKVRTDNSEEMELITKRLREMIKTGEQQSRTIQGLQKELKEKKNIIIVFADENTDLTKEVTTLRDKMEKYEAELAQATKSLERHFALTLIRKDGVDNEIIDQMIAPKLTISKVLKDLQTGDDAEAQKVKRLSSDPVMLRTQLREAQERIHELIEVLTDTNDKIERMEREMEEKDAKINDLLKEVSTLQDELDAKLEEEETKSKAVLSVTGLPVKMASHMCIKCKCSFSRSEISISRVPSVVPVISEDKEMTREDAAKLTKKIHFYKNALADTELNLSNAYKEISVLRRKCLEEDDEDIKAIGKSNKVVITSVNDSSSSSSNEEIIIVPKNAANMLGVSPAEPSGKSATAVTLKEGVVKKDKRKKKHFERVPSHRGPIDIPPQEVPPPDMELQAIPAPKGTREHTLWAVGDLQGKLNQLAINVMSFIQEIANVLMEEQAKKHPTKEPAAKPAPKQFEFGNTPAGGKMGALSKLGDKADTEAQQRKAQVLTSGQRAVALIREAYDMLSKSLNLGHDEYEVIYRSYKRHQQIRAYQQPHVQNPNGDYGRKVTMGTDANSYEYYLRSLQTSQSKSKVVAANALTYRKDSRYDMYHSNKYMDDSNTSIASTESAHARHRLKGTVMVMGMKRSRTDLDVGSLESLDGRTESMLRLTRERSQVFLVNMPNYGQRYREFTEVHREEAQIATAKIPKKGMLKLTSLEQEMANPNLYDKQRDEEEKPVKRKSLASNVKSLIKRKDIIKQLQMGVQKLEHEQEMEENMQEENLENYTMGDLQKNIMSFAEKTRRGSRKASLVKPGSIVIKAMENQHHQATIQEERKTGKTIELPSINLLANFK